LGGGARLGLWCSFSSALAVALLIFIGIMASSQRTLRGNLDESTAQLRSAEARVMQSDEALGLSESSNAFNERYLKESLERGRVGDNRLGYAVAQDLAGDEHELRSKLCNSCA
jgi:hypothetical protein